MTQENQPSPSDEEEFAPLTDADLDELLAALFGQREPDFGENPEKHSTVLHVDGTPVRLTIEYPEGHAKQAAQVLLLGGSPLQVGNFLDNFASDAEFEAAGITREDHYAATEKLNEPGSDKPWPDPFAAARAIRDGADVADYVL